MPFHTLTQRRPFLLPLIGLALAEVSSSQRVIADVFAFWGPSINSVHVVPDVNGDGQPDLWFVYSQQARIVCGRSFQPTSLQAHDPSASGPMQPCVDLDGDGVVDGVVSGGQGTSVRYYSMRTGALLFQRQNPYGITVASGPVRLIGDLNGDGLPEFSLTTGFRDVFIFDGGDGSFLRLHAVGASFNAVTFWPAIAPIHDDDGDGVGDYVLANAVANALQVVCGRTGSTLRMLVGGTLGPPFAPGQPEGFGRTVDVIGDIDLDGVPDLVVGCHTLSAFLPSGVRIVDPGRTKIVNSMTGQVIWMTEGDTWAAPPASLGGAFGLSGGDLDGDGFLDVLHAASFDCAIFRSGRTAEVLWRVLDRDPQDPFFGLSLRGILPDIDRDGHDDMYGIIAPNRVLLLAGGPVEIDRQACPGTTNSLAREARLDWQGPLAVGRTHQDLALTGGFPGALALVFAAPSGTGLPATLAPLCLCSPVQRLGGVRVLDVAGGLVQRIDWGAPWSQLFQPWLDLEVQAVYRDPLGASGLAVTNAVRVHLSP